MDRAADYESAHTCFANSFNISIRRAELKQPKLRIILTFTGFSESYRIFWPKKSTKKAQNRVGGFFTDPILFSRFIYLILKSIL